MCKYLQRISIIVLLVATTFSCASRKQGVSYSHLKSPKREFRGAWMSTAWQSRYRTMTPEQMKQYFVTSLDDLQTMGINAVIFQVRPQADAFYKSKYEPWSVHLSGTQGVAPADGFDPLKFIIEECHKRNMELHAWLNPYRVTTSENDVLVSNHKYYRSPELFIKYGGKIYFDPGMKGSRDFMCSVIEDILLNYNVDAIHMDDYFYPYPIAGESFPDDRSFEMTRKDRGFSTNEKADWRRDNVNLLIKEVKETINRVKPWVRFGISPFGIYRNKGVDPNGSDTRGLQNYDDLYADVKLWVEKGWIDYNMPQLYWEIGHKTADYTTLLNWWANNNFEQPLYIGQDVVRTMNGLKDIEKSQLSEKMIRARSLPTVHGNCFWPAYSLLENYKGVADELKRDFHRYPALIPAYTHMHNKRPKKVDKLQIESANYNKTLRLTWKSNSDKYDPTTAQYYVVYRFAKGERENLDNVENIVVVTRDTSLELSYEGTNTEYKYVVTAVDGFHNESKGRSKKIKL